MSKRGKHLSNELSLNALTDILICYSYYKMKTFFLSNSFLSNNSEILLATRNKCRQIDNSNNNNNNNTTSNAISVT